MKSLYFNSLKGRVLQFIMDNRGKQVPILKVFFAQATLVLQQQQKIMESDHKSEDEDTSSPIP